MGKKEKALLVDTFKPRWYQIPIMNAIERDGYKRVIVVLARRAGKDVVALNIMLRMAFKRVGCYYYIFPSKDQCRKVLWNSILNDGRRFLDFIPRELIKGEPNKTELRIDLINGSIIYFTGTNRMDGIRGANPVGVVFSEYAYAEFPKAYESVIRPIHANNGGWTLFISTPNGENQFFRLYQQAQNNDKWYTLVADVTQTKHMTEEALQEERDEMPEDLFNREYMCSFATADSGSFYGKYIAQAYKHNRIANIPHDASCLVHTAWDLGYGDQNVILFFQVVDQKVNIINYYKKNHEGLGHFVDMLNVFKQEYGYIYGKHFVPHDAKNHDYGSGLTRIETAEKLGIEFTVLPKLRFPEGINLVYSTFSKIFINENLCADFIDNIRRYSKKWNKERQAWVAYEEKKDETNHDADALRYLCTSLSEINTNYMSDDEFKKRKYRAYNRNIRFGNF